MDTYVTDVQNAAHIVPVNDQNLLRFAVVRGLKPAIRLHVLQTGAQTLDAVIKAARVAEAALSASGPTDDLFIYLFICQIPYDKTWQISSAAKVWLINTGNTARGTQTINYAVPQISL